MAHNLRDYEEARRAFHLEVPSVFNYARDVVDAWARHAPHKLALLSVSGDGGTARPLTFADVARASNRAANLLAAHGIDKGDRVFVMLPRVPEWYEVVLGCFKLGAVPMPATPLLTAKDIEYRLLLGEASAVVTDEGGAAKVDEVRRRCPTLGVSFSIDEPGPSGSPPWRSWGEAMRAASDAPPGAEPTRASDPLLLYFTSGTVGLPKMVLHTHASCGIGHEITARFWQDLGSEDLHWTFSDTGWAKAAWGKLFGQWRRGAAVFLWDVRGKPNFDRMLWLIGRYGVTTFCAPPTVFRALILRDLSRVNLGHLRHVVSAGEPLNPEAIHAWREGTGLTIHDGYGQTETVNLVANFPGMPVHAGSMGRPTPGFDVAVVDEDGVQLPPGDEGDIAVRVRPDRPVGLFEGYWRDPEATAAVHRGDWYLTGDRAVGDDRGYLWFVGRADDVINSSGYRIGPFEVESALVEHPAVAEAAVIGKPDRLRGEIVKAFVTLTPGVEGSSALRRELQAHVKSVTAPYKYPREIEFVEELPKTVSGKIRRGELRERERSEQAAGSPAG